MGFFNRLTDFGDRELVRAHATRIGVGLNQIENATSIPEIKGLSIAIKQEVQAMMLVALKLSRESINCLDVNINGTKIPFTMFVERLERESARIVARGGFSIIS